MALKKQLMKSKDAGLPAELFFEGIGRFGQNETKAALPDRNMRRFPVLFLSDLHLGANGCRGDRLVDFLNNHWADTIYLVGDVFDVWRPLGANWRTEHHEVLRILMNRAQSGVKIYYTPGNHDAFFRQYFGEYFDAIVVADHVYHEAADGTRYLVIHGDSVDLFECRAPFLSRFGAHVESMLRSLQSGINRARAQLDRPEWTGVERLLARFNSVLRSRTTYQNRLADLARSHGADGIICGHFHKPALHRDLGVVYANCGDWTENCTAIAETASGRLVMLDWAEEPQSVFGGQAAQSDDDAVSVGV